MQDFVIAPFNLEKNFSNEFLSWFYLCLFSIYYLFCTYSTLDKDSLSVLLENLNFPTSFFLGPSLYIFKALFDKTRVILYAAQTAFFYIKRNHDPQKPIGLLHRPLNFQTGKLKWIFVVVRVEGRLRQIMCLGIFIQRLFSISWRSSYIRSAACALTMEMTF